MYERILVPVDGSSTSKRGLDEALGIALKLGSTVRLLHVVDDASLAAVASSLASNLGELLASLAQAGEQILADAKARAQARGIAAETVMRHCAIGRVSDVIVKEAAEWPGDLIVIGTHGRRGAPRLLLGSDAELVLRSAPAPVLLVREAGRAG